MSIEHFAMFDFFFCKNEACVNCGTLNPTTLIWLLKALALTCDLGYQQGECFSSGPGYKIEI